MRTIRKEEKYPLALLETYLSVVEKSVGSEMFRTLYVRKGRRLVDVIDNGDLACAYFVSAILHLFGLIRGGVHTTVKETERDMIASGWERIARPKKGCIIFWTWKMGTDGAPHRHLGFYMGKDEAISNSSEHKVPTRHHFTYGKEKGKPARKIEALYSHPRLSER